MNPDEISARPARSPREPAGHAQCCAFHVIAVAAVAEVPLRGHPSAPAFRKALVLLIVLHDIGKISDSFQSACQTNSNWFRQCQGV